MSIARGLKNNNPGNIRITKETWVGKVPVSHNTDKSFEQFTSMPYGIRALMSTLRTYINTKKLNTIAKIFPVYAPASDNNDTKAYIANVSKRTGIGANSILTPNHDTLTKLAKAIIIQENGSTGGIPDSTFSQAYGLLGSVSGSAVSMRPSIPKPVIYIGLGIAGLGLGYLAYRKFSK